MYANLSKGEELLTKAIRLNADVALQVQVAAACLREAATITSPETMSMEEYMKAIDLAESCALRLTSIQECMDAVLIVRGTNAGLPEEALINLGLAAKCAFSAQEKCTQCKRNCLCINIPSQSQYAESVSALVLNIAHKAWSMIQPFTCKLDSGVQNILTFDVMRNLATVKLSRQVLGNRPSKWKKAKWSGAIASNQLYDMITIYAEIITSDNQDKHTRQAAQVKQVRRVLFE